MRKKVLITVGGTGGHVYPALTLAKKLLQLEPDIQLLFVGGGLNKNRYFEKDDFSFRSVACATLSLKSPIKSLGNLYIISKGIWQSRKIIQEFAPQLVVGFGSYHTFPVLIAAKLSGLPIVLHEANRIPGKVNKLLSPYISVTGVHFPDTAKFLKGRILEIPMPLREGFQKGLVSKELAREHYGLDKQTKTIMIFGGSLGAKAVNQLAADALSLLSHTNTFQILHFTGDPRSAQSLEEFYKKKGIRACVKQYENRMDLAWQASDMVISRSGAGTLAEQLEFEVPGILIPYPQAAENHQEHNADFMVDVVGGAIKCLENDLTPEILSKAIKNLLNEQLDDLQSNMRRHKLIGKPKALENVIQEML